MGSLGGLPDWLVVLLLFLGGVGPYVALGGHGGIAWVAIRRFFSRVSARISGLELTYSTKFTELETKFSTKIGELEAKVSSIVIPAPPQIPDVRAIVQAELGAALESFPSSEEIELKLNDTRERLLAGIQAWWGHRADEFRKELEKGAGLTGAAAEIAELEPILGKKGAAAIAIVERRMKARREQRQEPTPPSAPAATGGAPANGSKIALKPEVIAAMEAAGFSRTVKDESSSSGVNQ